MPYWRSLSPLAAPFYQCREAPVGDLLIKIRSGSSSPLQSFVPSLEPIAAPEIQLTRCSPHHDRRSRLPRPLLVPMSQRRAEKQIVAPRYFPEAVESVCHRFGRDGHYRFNTPVNCFVFSLVPNHPVLVQVYPPVRVPSLTVPVHTIFPCLPLDVCAVNMVPSPAMEVV